MDSAQHLLEKTLLKSLAMSTFGKIAALPASAHVASRSQYLLGIGSGPQATASHVTSVALSSVCI